MPPLESTDLWQTAVLWSKVDYDEYGQPSLGDPVNISVRWVYEQSVVQDRQGNNISLDATVLVAQDIPLGSKMWLGNVTDWQQQTGTTSPIVTGDNQIMEVKTISKVKDIKGRFIRRTVGLMRYNVASDSPGTL